MLAGSSWTQTISRALGCASIAAVIIRLRQRVELVEEEDGRVQILAAAALGAQFVPDFAAGNQDAVCVGDFGIGHERLEAAGGEKSASGRAGVADGAACSSA